MKNFKMLSGILTCILIMVSLILDQMLGIFMVCVLACIFLDGLDRKERRENHDQSRKA